MFRGFRSSASTGPGFFSGDDWQNPEHKQSPNNMTAAIFDRIASHTRKQLQFIVPQSHQLTF
jgi:hypothetical protein